MLSGWISPILPGLFPIAGKYFAEVFLLTFVEEVVFICQCLSFCLSLFPYIMLLHPKILLIIPILDDGIGTIQNRSFFRRVFLPGFL